MKLIEILNEAAMTDPMELAKLWCNLVTLRQPSKKQLIEIDKIGKRLYELGILEINPYFEPNIGDVKYHLNKPPKDQNMKKIWKYIHNSIS